MSYYSLFQSEIRRLVAMGAELRFIGRTAFGRMIPSLYVGNHNGSSVLAQYSIHAREHITTALALRQIEYALEHKHELVGGIYFVPLVNIDGVLLAHDPNSAGVRLKELVRINGGSKDFSLWKANLNAVDLNVNFCARWGCGKHNIKTPAPENYVGACPNSEPETRALIDFTMRVKPSLTLSYHCKGQELYWYFYQSKAAAIRDLEIACMLGATTGYRVLPESVNDLDNVPPRDSIIPSAGGYKDFCIQHLEIPSFTLEIVDDAYSHPIDIDVAEEFERNKDVPLLSLQIANNIYLR